MISTHINFDAIKYVTQPEGGSWNISSQPVKTHPHSFNIGKTSFTFPSLK